MLNSSRKCFKLINIFRNTNFISKHGSALLKNDKYINYCGNQFCSIQEPHDKYCSSEILKENIRLHLFSKTLDFPFVWLRDNCQCEKCFHPVSKSRIISWKNFSVNEEPESIIYDKNKNNIVINWKDKHNSIFNIKWLEERSFLKENMDNYLNHVYKPKKISWNKEEFTSVFKKFNYDIILKNDEILKDWLEKLSIYGVALVTNVPAADDSCRNLANRVEFIKRTHYGEEFIVRAKPGTTNVAYLSSNLQLHTDLPYYEYKPGVNLLHCLTQSLGKGGDNILCDGLYVANILKKEKPKIYKILSQTLVEWEDFGKENNNKFHSLYRSPVICEDMTGDIIRINHSIPQRGSHFNIPLERVKPWYEALKIFVDLIHQHSTTFKMAPGELLCFDNRRLLHGRNEYKDTHTNARHVIGAYLDWDFIYSRLRILSQGN